jgi:hypothetical protein
MSTPALVAPAWPEGPRLLHPDQALQEQLEMLRSARDPRHRALRLHAFEERREALGTSLTTRTYGEFLDDLPALLVRARPVLWSSEMWALANLAGESYPDADVRWSPDMFLVPVQYWAYETDHLLDRAPALAALGFTGEFSRLVGCVDGLVFDAIFLVLPGGPFFPLCGTAHAGALVAGPHGQLAAKLDFLRSTVVAHHAVGGGRGLRKDWRRRTGEDAPPVRVVTLRRQQAGGGEAAGTVEWGCRWIVSGHWRNQYLPASGGHRPTWIGAHVKGPDSKPLKPPAVTVFVVKR